MTPTATQKAAWHFDRCTLNLCGIVSVHTQGSYSAPSGIQTNPLMAAWQITHQYLCNLHQWTSNRSDRGKFKYGRVLQRGRLLPCTPGWPLPPETYPVLQHHHAAWELLLLNHRGRFTGQWYWSVTQACAQEFHSPIKRQLDNSSFSSTTHGMTDEWIS